MEDEQIIELLFERSERAIWELTEKYGKLLFHISENILNNREDALECVNDTYFGVWNAIPPERPNPFISYICRIVRNISLKKYRDSRAKKRNSSHDTSMEELEDIFSAPSAEEVWSAKELGKLIDCFLDTLDSEKRILFVRRYYFSESVKSLAGYTGMTENHVSVKLSRIRRNLKKYLEEEGYSL